MKQEYVVGFMFNQPMDSVVLISKNRPTWQAGKMNGVGGHIEDGETPQQAMEREFREETGIGYREWVELCEHRGPDFVVHYFYATSDRAHSLASTRTDETVDRYNVDSLDPSRLVPHVGWLLMAAVTHHNLPDYAAQFSGEHVDRKTDSYTLIVPQPPPVVNNSTPVWDLVIQDMRARDAVGREKYGTPLQSFNGRDSLVDSYQEALDLVVYLRQAIEERECGVTDVLNKILPPLK